MPAQRPPPGTSRLDAASLALLEASLPEVFFAVAEERAVDAPWAEDLVHPDDRAGLREVWATARRDGAPFDVRARLRADDGTFQASSVRGAPIRDAAGTAVCWIATRAPLPIEDDTEAADATKQAVRADRVEEELRVSNQMLAGIAASTAGAIYSYRRSREGDVSLPYLSAAMAEIFGVSVEEMRRDPPVVGRVIHPDDVERVLSAIAHSAATMTPWHCEYRIANPLRGEVWVEGKSTPILSSDGSITWHGVLLEVTERKRDEAVVRAERDRFAALAETVPGALYTYRRTASGAIEFPYFSTRIVEIYGVTAEAMMAHPDAAFELIHPDDLPMVVASSERAVDTASPWQAEFRILHPTRGERWLEGRSQPMREADGGLVFHGVFIDVTERRRSEERLRASEATLRAVVETVPDFLILIGRNGAIQYINRLLPGFTLDDVVGAPAMDFIAEEMRADVAAAIERTFATASIQHSEARVTPRDASPGGVTRWFHTRIGPVVADGEVIAVTLASTDTTEQKLAEIALRSSEERYRMLVELLPDAVFVHAAGKITFCNDAFVRLMGAISQEQLIGTTPLDVVHPDDHPIVRERVRHILSHKEAVPAVEVSVVRLDGGRRRVSVVAAPIFEHADNAILVVLHDLSPRRRTENLLLSVLESVEDAILTIDARGTILSCNSATSRMFGYPIDDLFGRNVKVLMPEPYRSEHDGYLARFMGSAVENPVVRGREVFGQRKGGATFPLELNVTGFRLDGVQHFTGVVRDITARRKLEAQFRQAHKMEAFGQLAGGVAHDFNNLLTVILGESAHLASRLGPHDPSAPSLAEIHEAGQRAAGLTRQLLAFSRKSVLEPKVLDVNVIVRETQQLLVRLIGEDIHLTTDLARDLTTVHVDPGQLGQVLMNLAVNARDAMPKGGELAISTANVTLDAAAAKALGLQDGPFVKLTVRDSGTGMSAEVRSRVFQPFFTTKGVGKGTGLGLAVVHGIVTQSGGAIDLDSEVGRGTRWDVYLPAARATPSQAALPPSTAPAPAQATVLVVEDDEAVRRLARRLLTAKGYTVIVARHGGDALEVLSRQDEPVDLVITDVVMPVLDGRELAEQLRERYPAIKVLYTSGYTDDVLVRRGLQAEAVDFLQKPYSVASLVSAVARRLAKP